MTQRSRDCAAASEDCSRRAPFVTLDPAESFGLSLPRVVTPDGVRRRVPEFDAVPLVSALSPANIDVVSLFEGAYADPVATHRPGTFFGLTNDPSLLDGVEFIRLRVFLYSNPTIAPEVDQIEILFD